MDTTLFRKMEGLNGLQPNQLSLSPGTVTWNSMLGRSQSVPEGRWWFGHCVIIPHPHFQEDPPKLLEIPKLQTARRERRMPSSA
jgi:hypothetical protein